MLIGMLGEINVMNKDEEIGKEMISLRNSWEYFLDYMGVMECNFGKDGLGEILGKFGSVRMREWCASEYRIGKGDWFFSFKSSEFGDREVSW